MTPSWNGEYGDSENDAWDSQLYLFLSNLFIHCRRYCPRKFKVQRHKHPNCSIILDSSLFLTTHSNPLTKPVSLTSKYIQNATTFHQVSHPLIGSIHWHFSPESLERLSHSIKHQISLRHKPEYVTAVLKTLQWLPMSLSLKSDYTTQPHLTPSYPSGLSSSYSSP